MNNEQLIELEHIYSPQFDAFKDSDELIEFRQAFALLTLSERRILMLYVELGTYRKVATVLGVNYMSVSRIINKVRDKMKRVVQYQKLEF